MFTGSDAVKSWHIASAEIITIEHPLLAKLLEAAMLLNASVPLSSIELLLALDGSYNYKIITKTGRTWNQKIIMDLPADPAMTWIHADSWRASEFAKQQPLRLLITQVIQSIKPSAMRIIFN